MELKRYAGSVAPPNIAIYLMKTYLIVSGAIFGLIALLHLFHAIAQWSLVRTNPGEFLAMAALGVVAAGLSLWAWRLLRMPRP